MTLSVAPCPKPKKRRKNKPKKRGICPSCGTFFIGPAVHSPECLGEIPPIITIKKKTESQLLIAAQSDVCRYLTAWIYGDVWCVLEDVDGAHCGGMPQWGHVIPQGQSGWLRNNPSNFARQCAAHNVLHKNGDPIYFLWYQHKFGRLALEMLREESKAHQGIEIPIIGMRDNLKMLSALYDNRFTVNVCDMESMVAAGYYGSVVKAAWEKEGRI